MSKETEPIFIVRLPKVYNEDDLERIGVDLNELKEMVKCV